MTTKSTLLSGAGRAEIPLAESSFPVDGFSGVHDALHVRVVLFASGDADRSERCAIVSIEMTSLPGDLVDEVRSVLRRIADVDARQVLVAATHTFSAPHVVPADRRADGERGPDDALRNAVLDAVVAAGETAVHMLAPASIRSGTGTCAVNVNRDVETPFGAWLGVDERGFSDHVVPVVRIDDRSGSPIAVIAALDVQSSVLDHSVTHDGRRLVSGDLAGAAAATVEAALPGVVTIVLAGCGGDQAPSLVAVEHRVDPATAMITHSDAGSAGFTIAERLGRRLGTEVVRVVAGCAPSGSSTVRVTAEEVVVDAQREPRHFSELAPTTTWVSTPDGTRSTPIVALALGSAVIIGVQPELTSIIGSTIRRRSPFVTTIAATLVNGAAKYMADAGAYDRRTYAAMNSRFARGAAERVARRAVDLLERTMVTEPPTEARG